MRIMGLDFGSRTVGVAISDSLLLTAQGVEIIRRKEEENKLRQTLARIEELIVENEVEEIVLGLHERYRRCPRGTDQRVQERSWSAGPVSPYISGMD